MRRLQIKTDLQTPWVKVDFDQFMGRMVSWTCPPKPITQTQKIPVSFTPIIFFCFCFCPLKSQSEANTVSKGGCISSQPKLYAGGVSIWASHTNMSLQSMVRNRHFRAGDASDLFWRCTLESWGAIPWICLYLLVDYAWPCVSSDESRGQYILKYSPNTFFKEAWAKLSLPFPHQK